MADDILNPRDIIASYTIDLPTGQTQIIKISAKVKTIAVEVVFINSTGSALVQGV